MADSRKGPFSNVIDDVLTDIKRLRKEADKSKTVPLGMERITPSELMQRIQGASPEQRREIFQKYGIEGIARATQVAYGKRRPPSAFGL